MGWRLNFFAKFLVRVVLGYVIALPAWAASTNAELKLVSVEKGFVRVELWHQGNIVKPDKILGANGMVAVKTKAYNPRNMLAVKLYSTTPSEQDVLALQSFINRDNSISLPVVFNYREASEPGYQMTVEVAMITKKNELLSAATTIDLLQAGSRSAFQSIEIYQSILSRLKDIQLSSAQVERLAQSLKTADQYKVCSLSLTAWSRPGWSMSKQHCNPDKNAVFGDSFVMQECAELSDRLFADLIEAAAQQCQVEEIARQQIGRAFASELVSRLVSQKLQYMQIYQSTASLDQVYEWYEAFLPDSLDEAKKLMKAQLNKVGARRKQFSKMVASVVETDEYADLVVSELASAIVTQNVRERDLVKNICTSQVAKLSPQQCYDFASDVANALLKPFSATDLSELYGKAESIRRLYRKALESKVPKDFVYSSIKAVSRWAEAYAKREHLQSNCFNRSVFPLGFMAERNRIPNPDLVARSGSGEYQYMIDQYASTLKTALYQLGESLRRYPKLKSGELEPISCTDTVILGPTFDLLFGVGANPRPVTQ